LTGDYYIAVYGFYEASYHIYYRTERVEEDKDGNQTVVKLPIQLKQNKPMRGILKSSTDYERFKFVIRNITTTDEIVVHLIPQHGKFKFFVKFEGDVSPKSYDKYGSYDNHYIASFDPRADPKYRSGVFNIYVVPVHGEQIDTDGMAFTFLISFFIGTHHIPLMENNPTYGYVVSDKVNYYTFMYKSGVPFVNLVLTKTTGHTNMVVSLDETITFPTKDDVNINNGVFLVHEEHKTYDHKVLEKYCGHKNGYCNMTIGVYSVSDSATYTITAISTNDNNDTAIRIIENGMPQYGSLAKGKWDYYYFKTSNKQPVYAVLVPNMGDPNLYVTMVTDLNMKQYEWPKPTLEDSDGKSEDSIGADILMLSEKKLERCKGS
jgi:hypothetical protein